MVKLNSHIVGGTRKATVKGEDNNWSLISRGKNYMSNSSNQIGLPRHFLQYKKVLDMKNLDTSPYQ